MSKRLKADFRKGGVGWETMVIQGDMLSQGDNNRKYIALVKDEQIDKSIPIYMKSKYALQVNDSGHLSEPDWKQLILALFDRNIEPTIGPIPDFVLTASNTTDERK